VSGEQAATALESGAIKPELLQTPSPFVGPPPALALILVGFALDVAWSVGVVASDDRHEAG